MDIPAIERPRTPSPPPEEILSLASSPAIEFNEPIYDHKSLSPISGTFPRYASISETTGPWLQSPLSPSNVHLSPYRPNRNTSNGEDNITGSPVAQPFNFKPNALGRVPASPAAARQAVIISLQSTCIYLTGIGIWTPSRTQICSKQCLPPDHPIAYASISPPGPSIAPLPHIQRIPRLNHKRTAAKMALVYVPPPRSWLRPIPSPTLPFDDGPLASPVL
jgi:hypothetical protein